MGATQQAVDRRKHPRQPLAIPVRFHHDPTGKDLPGRCVDISQGGMRMYVPANTPVKSGQEIVISMGDIEANGLSQLSKQQLPGRVVHVNRYTLISTGQLAVGVEFVQESAIGAANA